jgi:cytoplasmic iron level regulating protein YaaA (DUF328/UPF0246 family)
MARWMITHRVERASELRKAELEGYRLDDSESTDTSWVFRRQQPPPKNG